MVTILQAATQTTSLSMGHGAYDFNLQQLIICKQGQDLIFQYVPDICRKDYNFDNELLGLSQALRTDMW